MASARAHVTGSDGELRGGREYACSRYDVRGEATRFRPISPSDLGIDIFLCDGNDVELLSLTVLESSTPTLTVHRRASQHRSLACRVSASSWTWEGGLGYLQRWRHCSGVTLGRGADFSERAGGRIIHIPWHSAPKTCPCTWDLGHWYRRCSPRSPMLMCTPPSLLHPHLPGFDAAVCWDNPSESILFFAFRRSKCGVLMDVK
ncbi:hypothetical protein DFH08DRAFT_360106 [Mycena albidolilacea]|uniref:Uncharacterized protein n=1 Tax=Mycena albidolilacea TaxID=1033008 RepID=A0AAD7AJK0_9AGAR|nr:hypothetical protein DFH08DRAFT_360106 [Mycena albidolilacea]